MLCGNINNKFNGVNTEVLNSALNSIKNQPEMAKAMFSQNGMVVLVLHLASKIFTWAVKLSIEILNIYYLVSFYVKCICIF